MKNFLSLDIKTIAILLLVGIVLFLQFCGGHKTVTTPGKTIYVDGKPYEVIKQKIDTQYIPKEVIKKVKGETIYVDTTIYVEIPGKIDTMSILKDYFAKRVEKDTLHLPDSLGYVALTDTLSRNRIYAREWHAIVNKMTVTDQTIVKETKGILYFGFDGSFTKTDVVNSLVTGLIYKAKKTNNLYQIGVGVSHQSGDLNLTPYIKGGIYWPIRLKK